MDNSDPVSLAAYWLPVSLIPPAEPIGAVATVSDVGMKGQKEGGEEDREIEVKAEKTDDVGRGEKWRVTRMEMWNKRKPGMWRRKLNPLY